jgi:hypothetical protein
MALSIRGMLAFRILFVRTKSQLGSRCIQLSHEFQPTHHVVHGLLTQGILSSNLRKH